MLSIKFLTMELEEIGDRIKEASQAGDCKLATELIARKNALPTIIDEQKTKAAELRNDLENLKTKQAEADKAYSEIKAFDDELGRQAKVIRDKQKEIAPDLMAAQNRVRAVAANITILEADIRRFEDFIPPTGSRV